MPILETKPGALDKATPRTPLACAPGASPAPDQVQTRSRLNPLFQDTLGLKYRGGGGTRFGRTFGALAAPLAAFSILFSGIFLHAQVAPLAPSEPPAKPQKRQRPPSENIEWMWQYTPDDVNKDGRENDLVQDLRFRPFLDQYLTAPQSFWGTPIDGRPRTLATTALDHLTVPDKVIADENRYISVQGCVVHFCPARGLLWVDLGGQHDHANAHHLVVFAALDWAKEGKPTTDPAAEYTLWLFPDEPFTIGPGPNTPQALHPPAALTKALARWAAEPLAGSGIVQNITHAILVDPDGTPHEVPPSALGITPKTATPEPEAAPALKPRN